VAIFAAFAVCVHTAVYELNSVCSDQPKLKPTPRSDQLDLI